MKHFFGLSLLAVMAIALGLRAYKLGAQDYWLDELHSMANSAGRRAAFESLAHGVVIGSAPRFPERTAESTAGAVWSEMKVDTHPPLYFLVLLGWRRLFGDGEFATRSLSALFSVLSLAAVALIFLEQGKRLLGIAGACLLAVAFTHILMAQETRPYSLALLLVSIDYWLFTKVMLGWDAFGRGRRFLWSIFFAVSVYLTFLTHYFAVLALAGQFVVAVLEGRRRSSRIWLVVMAVAGLGFLLAWGRAALGQLSFITDQPWLLEGRTDHGLRTLLRLADLPARLLFTHQPFQFHYARAAAGALVIVGAFWILFRHRCNQARAFAAWYLAPVVCFTLVDLLTQRQTLAHVRYTSIALPGLVGIGVWATSLLPRPARWAVVAATTVVVALTLRLPAASHPHSRLAAELIAQRLQPEDLLVFDAIDWPPFWALSVYHTVSYYLPSDLSGPPPPFVLLRERPSQQLQAEMQSYPRILVVSPRVDDGISHPVPAGYRLVEQTGRVRDVGVIYLFARR